MRDAALRSVAPEARAVERELNREILLSGQFRSLLVGVTAAVGFAFFLATRWLGSDPYSSLYAGHSPNLVLGMVTGAVMGFEAVWRAVLGRFASRGVVLGAPTHVGIAAAEITALSFTLWWVGGALTVPALTLALPASLVYFPLVVLSAFALDVRVVVAVTAVAVGQYLGVLGLLGLPPSPATGSLGPFGSVWLYAHQSVLLALTGGVAAVVAREARRRVLDALAAQTEHERVVRLWGRHLAPEVVRSLVAGEEAPRRQDVAVLFLDIRGFTDFTERHSPERVVAFLNDFFEVSVGVVLDHGGVVHQLLGDGFLALFGVPGAHADDARQAVRASIAIHHAVGEAVRAGTLPPTRIGIGVHCGEALVGVVGTRTYREYKVTGDVVNVTARIEAHNKEVGSAILVSDEAWRRADVDAVAEAVGPVTLRGRAAAVALHRLA